MSVPKLEELFEKFRKLNSLAQRDAFEQHFRSIASGQAEPELRKESAVFAAQCVVILFEHTKVMEAGET